MIIRLNMHGFLRSPGGSSMSKDVVSGTVIYVAGVMNGIFCYHLLYLLIRITNGANMLIV